jgi:predicted AlkP superfamily phosphohydrolase/phosphomutase
VAPGQVPALRRRLENDLANIRDPAGNPLRVQILDPKTLYHEVRGDAPDLMLYFGDLKWRSAGTLGYPSLFLKENDTGPDDAVHSFDGMFLWTYPGGEVPGVDLPVQQIRDVAPTILQFLGLPIPSHIQGRPIGLDADPAPHG